MKQQLYRFPEKACKQVEGEAYMRFMVAYVWETVVKQSLAALVRSTNSWSSINCTTSRTNSTCSPDVY